MKILIFALMLFTMIFFLFPGDNAFAGTVANKRTCKPYIEGTKKFDILKIKYKRNRRWVWEPQTFPGSRYTIKRNRRVRYTHSMPLKLYVLNEAKRCLHGRRGRNFVDKAEVERILNVAQGAYDRCAIRLDLEGVDYIEGPAFLSHLDTDINLHFEEKCLMKPTHRKNRVTVYFVCSARADYAVTDYWQENPDYTGAVVITAPSRSEFGGGIKFALPHEIGHAAGGLRHQAGTLMETYARTDYLNDNQCRSVRAGRFVKPIPR